MIINSFAVLDGFLAAIRLPASLLVVGLAMTVWRTMGRPESGESRCLLENRRWYLLVLLSIVLVGLNVVAWPVFYALLQSYVPQWPGVMCIYGVMRIGAESQGISRFLPALLTTLQVTKPAVVFAGGAVAVLYFLNRRTSSSTLIPPIVKLMVVLGLLSATDAALEVAYLVIPKSEQFHEAGCCTVSSRTMEISERSRPPGQIVIVHRGWLAVAYGTTNGVLVTGLLGSLLGARKFGTCSLIPVVRMASIVCAPVSWYFLQQIAAPEILGLPYHHCPYDLVTAAPESVMGIILFLLGWFSMGWEWVASWGSRAAGIQTALAERFQFLALFGFAASVAVFAVEMLLTAR